MIRFKGNVDYASGLQQVNCLFCNHYGFWDGDYVCMSYLKILSEGDKEKHWAAKDPQNIIYRNAKNCPNFEKCDVPARQEATIDIWNNLNPKYELIYKEDKL